MWEDFPNEEASPASFNSNIGLWYVKRVEAARVCLQTFFCPLWLSMHSKLLKGFGSVRNKPAIVIQYHQKGSKFLMIFRPAENFSDCFQFTISGMYTFCVHLMSQVFHTFFHKMTLFMSQPHFMFAKPMEDLQHVVQVLLFGLPCN